MRLVREVGVSLKRLALVLLVVAKWFILDVARPELKSHPRETFRVACLLVLLLICTWIVSRIGVEDLIIMLVAILSFIYGFLRLFSLHKPPPSKKTKA